MTRSEDWKVIKNYHLLVEAFGCWPTFHDAVVEKIVTRFDDRELEFTFRYSDLNEAGVDVKVLTTLRLTGVERCDFNLYGEDLVGIEFSFDRALRTVFEPYSFGLHGEFLSKGATVESVVILDSAEKRSREGIAFTFE